MKKIIKRFQKLTPQSEPSSNHEKTPELALSKPTEEPTLFASLSLDKVILRAVAEQGYSAPTPIQAKAVPHVIRGRDLLGCAQTGTGKTAAFALPILHRLANGKTSLSTIRALVVTPTRELALQVAESFETYGKYLTLRTAVVFGGVSDLSQKRILSKKPEILVATPGRLLDLMNQGFVKLDKLEIFVLDEADRMLDMGFIHDVKRIIKALPVKRQNLFFSATMPTDIQNLAMRVLRDPVKVEAATVSSTSEQVAQSLYYVEKENKRQLLLHVLAPKDVTRVLVFTRTKAIANRVTTFLNKEGIRAEAIHGNKSQSARQRALENFRHGRTRVLVASDLAARGIDVDAISHVVNFDMPNVPETYVHRIGRTGRAESVGKAVSFCQVDERSYVRNIEALIRKPIEVIEDHPYVSTLVASATSASQQRTHPARQRRGKRPATRKWSR